MLLHIRFFEALQERLKTAVAGDVMAALKWDFYGLLSETESRKGNLIELLTSTDVPTKLTSLSRPLCLYNQ